MLSERVKWGVTKILRTSSWNKFRTRSVFCNKLAHNQTTRLTAPEHLVAEPASTFVGSPRSRLGPLGPTHCCRSPKSRTNSASKQANEPDRPDEADTCKNRSIFCSGPKQVNSPYYDLCYPVSFKLWDRVQETQNLNWHWKRKIKDRYLFNFLLLLCDEYDENCSDDRVPILSGCKTRALRRWILRIHGLFE